MSEPQPRSLDTSLVYLVVASVKHEKCAVNGSDMQAGVVNTSPSRFALAVGWA
jgi:hypothetical protein